MEEYRGQSPFPSMGGGGGGPELGPTFTNNFLGEQPVVFGSGSAGKNSLTAAGAPKRGRERPRSPSPNFRPMAANHPSAGHQDAGKAAPGKSPDQQREEEAAKARRLLRFGAEFGTRPKPARPAAVGEDEEASMSVASAAGAMLEPGSRGLSAGQSNLRDNMQVGRSEAGVEPAVETDAPDNLTSEPILGICPDMCPEMERNERERKGDLDRFERLGGNRNQTARDLAVKKYTRTAEKDAVLIRPLPVLKMTMGHLLSLLERDHEDDLLPVHGFLWDRMRAVRMDLRMQHIFTEEAIVMHEQMIRFHILAMHELCEYSQGEGMTEVFNAHLNIEQMNKASVDLFQMYEDHLKRGVSVPSEAEFRGYYALLKLDKHPGYRVEPAELSLDLAKMTPEIRNSQQVRFARDVARACRGSNYVAFFRLARDATYLQACLMHAHFSKLRTQALASLYSGLQKNQGIPLSTVVDWLGMEGDDMEALIRYHGFSIKYYEEAYMVKEGPFLNKTQDFPTCRTQLVEAKRSLRIVMDVQGERYPEIVSRTPSEVKRNGGKLRIGNTERSGTLGSEVLSIQTSLSNVDNTKEEDMPDYIEEPGEAIEVVRVAPVVEIAKILAEEGKQGKKRHMEELQFEAEEHERRRLRHEADAVARRAASQAAIEAAALEIKRQEEELRIAGHTAEANVGKQGSWFRKWRRRAAAKALERHRKLLETEAALDALSLGYPLWKMRAFGESVSVAQRNEYTKGLVEEQGSTLQQMWDPLDIPSLVGPILRGLNPAAGVLYWKLFLATAACPSGWWVRTKVSSKGKLDTGERLADKSPSSITLAEESVFMSGNQEGSTVDFRYSARDLGPAILHSNVVLHGVGGLLFVANEDESVPMERARLQSLVQALPEGANVPLLVLSAISQKMAQQSIEQENWERQLNLAQLSTTKISGYRTISIAESSGSNPGVMGYFSDQALKEGIVWLAKMCPVQPYLRSLHVADLVREHLDAHLKPLLRLPPPEIIPDRCIKLFNKVLQNAAEEIVSVDSGFQKKFNGAGQGLIQARLGSNSSETLEAILADLKSCQLPLFPPLSPALHSGNMRLQKHRLEEILLQFFSVIEGSGSDNLAIKWEVSRMVQRGCTVEWHESGRKLVPKWGQIFQSIFSARLLLLSLKPWPPVHIAQTHKTPLQLYEFEHDIHKNQLVTSYDLTSEGQLLLDDIIGEELHRDISAQSEVWAEATDLALPSHTQGDDISCFTEKSSQEIQSRPQSIATSLILSKASNKIVNVSALQKYTGDLLPQQEGALAVLLRTVEEIRSKSLQLAFTQPERVLDKMLAELKQQKHSPVEHVQLRKVDHVHATLGLLPVTEDGEPKSDSCTAAEKVVEDRYSEDAPAALRQANQASGEKFLLSSSPFEALLDKMVSESRRRRSCSGSDQHVDMLTPNGRLYRGIEEHRAKYLELQSSSWSS